VVELSTSTEQIKVFKKKKVEAIEKQVAKLNELVTGSLWVKVASVETEQKLAWERYRTRAEALEALVETMKEPLLSESKALKSQNEAYAREMVRMQGQQREMMTSISKRVDDIKIP